MRTEGAGAPRESEAEARGHVWPPAVCPEKPQAVRRGQARWGVVSLLLAGLGWAAWIGAFAALGIWWNHQEAAQEDDILLPDPPGLILFANVALYTGPALSLLGLWPGVVSRRTWVGKVGLALSVLGLAVLGGLIIWVRAKSGHWPWGTPETPKAPCGCRWRVCSGTRRTNARNDQRLKSSLGGASRRLSACADKDDRRGLSSVRAGGRTARSATQRRIHSLVPTRRIHSLVPTRRIHSLVRPRRTSS